MQDPEADQKAICDQPCESGALQEEVGSTAQSSAFGIVAAWFVFGCIILVQFVMVFGSILSV